jgi:hypothetical protein
MFQDLECLMIRQRERWCAYTAFWTADSADAPVGETVAAVHAPEDDSDFDEDVVRTSMSLTPVLDQQFLERLNQWHQMSDVDEDAVRASMSLSDNARDAIFERMSDDELDAIFGRMP